MRRWIRLPLGCSLLFPASTVGAPAVAILTVSAPTVPQRAIAATRALECAARASLPASRVHLNLLGVVMEGPGVFPESV